MAFLSHLLRCAWFFMLVFQTLTCSLQAFECGQPGCLHGGGEGIVAAVCNFADPCLWECCDEQAGGGRGAEGIGLPLDDFDRQPVVGDLAGGAQDGVGGQEAVLAEVMDLQTITLYQRGETGCRRGRRCGQAGERAFPLLPGE